MARRKHVILLITEDRLSTLSSAIIRPSFIIIARSQVMVTSGIIRVIYDGDYPDDLGCTLAKEAGMELIKMSDMQKGI